MSLWQTARIGSEQSMKPPADGQGEQGCVQEALGNVPAAAAEIVDSVLGLELAEQQLDLPTGGVDGRDVLEAELLSWNIGQVEVVAMCRWVPYPDDSHRHRMMAPLGTMSLVVECAVEVDRLAVQASHHILQLLADEALVLGTSRGNDERIGVLLEPTQEKAAVQPDAIEEIPLEVAQIEDQQLVPHPRACSKQSQVVAAAVSDLNAARPTPDDIHHDVKLGRGGHVIGPDRWERGSECLVQPDHGPVRHQDLSERVEHEVQPGALRIDSLEHLSQEALHHTRQLRSEPVIKRGRSQARPRHALVRTS